jgi:DNA-binding response OmpR family regulator
MGKKRIMIVDDDKDFLDELKDVLESGGYDSVAVSDTNEVVDVAQRSRPDLVLLDLKMPGKSGFEMAVELRQAPGFAELPILAMSGCYDSGDFPLMQVHGIIKCFNKPLKIENIVSEINLLLKEQKAERRAVNHKEEK